MRGYLLGCAMVTLSGCATVMLPPNVQTGARPGVNGEYMEKVDFSFSPAHQVAFSKLKLCIAENVANDPVVLSSAGSPFSSQGNSQVVPGGAAIKYSDDAEKVIIASGTIDGGYSSLGIIHDLLKFELRGSVETARVGLVFQNITRAMQSTGSAPNDGFYPVGNWSGARPLQVYGVLNGIADKVKRCIQ